MKILLILSHRGKSFLSEWTKAVKTESDMSLAVLSSAPTEGELEFKNQWSSHFARIFCSQSIHLDLENIRSAVKDLQAAGYDVRAVLSVWEGHRALLAEINHSLGAPDISSRVVDFVKDKYELRRSLNQLGLSAIETCRLSHAGDLEKLRLQEGRWFLKPRVGLASFGAFELDSKLRWYDLLHLQQQAKNDEDYSEILGNSEFIAEQYIEGREYSFEVVAGAGDCEVIAIHEKVELQALSRTTLENACVSPPLDLSDKEVSDCKGWIRKIFKALRLDEGAYHVEARRKGFDTWEIIEINCRPGGAYICESAALVSGISLLRSWIQLVLEPNRRKRKAIISGYRQRRERVATTFFRVFFAEPGKKIEKIEIEDKNIQDPLLKKVFLKEGIEIPPSEREVFAAQALWAFPATYSLTDEFRRRSSDYFKIYYGGGSLCERN